MDIALIPKWDEVANNPPLRKEWRELLPHAMTNTIFQTFEWHDAWMRSFGKNYELKFYTVHKNGELVLIAPLIFRRRWLNFIREGTLSFIGADNFASDFCDFIVKKGNNDALIELLEKLRSENYWSMIDLFNLQSHSPTRPIIESFKSKLPFCIGRVSFDAPCIVFKTHPNADKLAQKKSLKRHFNYFNRNGDLKFENVENSDEILKELPTFFQQHIDRRALTKDASLFLEENQRQFYRHLTSLLTKTRELLFSKVTFNGEPLGYHFGFVYDNCFIWYKPSFNTKYLKKSPGEVLLKFLLEYSIEKNFKEFDFTVGQENFKYRFANEIRTNYQILFFRSEFSYALMRIRRRLSRVKKNTKGLIQRE